MNPVEVHCRTQRLNFLFFLFLSSLSVQVVMNTGSSSIKGSWRTWRHTCNGTVPVSLSRWRFIQQCHNKQSTQRIPGIIAGLDEGEQKSIGVRRKTEVAYDVTSQLRVGERMQPIEDLYKPAILQREQKYTFLLCIYPIQYFSLSIDIFPSPLHN